MKKILFIDRDGTLIKEPFDYQVDSLAKIRLMPQVIPSLIKCLENDFELVMVSNQDGLGTNSFAKEDFSQCQDFLIELFASQGIAFKAIFICPHFAKDNCACRKPKTGLVDEFMKNNSIDLKNSFMIGDRESDETFANNLKIPFLPINEKQGWTDIKNLILNKKRSFKLNRQTKETNIELNVCIDSEAKSSIKTPLPFFSHMLEQIAKHGQFSLQLEAIGDIEVDDHHLIEDTAICLGQALKEALSDKKGIARYGFTLPMDESLASVSIDLCGRSFCDFKANFSRESVGGIATEMIPHFFYSFAHSLNASLHIEVRGSNHHHMIEACFKALGQTLRQAMSKTSTVLPSTKGLL